MQAGQALINKTAQVAAYPAFLADLVNVYQTRVASALSVDTSEEKAWIQGEEKQPQL